MGHLPSNPLDACLFGTTISSSLGASGSFLKLKANEWLKFGSNSLTSSIYASYSVWSTPSGSSRIYCKKLSCCTCASALKIGPDIFISDDESVAPTCSLPRTLIAWLKQFAELVCLSGCERGSSAWYVCYYIVPSTRFCGFEIFCLTLLFLWLSTGLGKNIARSGSPLSTEPIYPPTWWLS